jgi:diguanylate cyclase (GGDEF)-like protein
VEAGDSAHRFEVLLRIRRADDGTERWMQTSGWRNEALNGHLERVLVTVRDVTEQHDTEERIRWTANHDALTGLPNRGLFNEQLEKAIACAQADKNKLVLVLFDVDNLKETNDTAGHDAGDMLLQRVADRLRNSLGSEVSLARLGGDEFAAFFQVDDEASMIALVQESLRDLREDCSFDGLTMTCQATAGSATFLGDAQSAQDLLKTADIALYAGKSGQRGVLSVFRSEMRAHVQRRASMLSVARSVINDGRVRAYYQPKVALSDGQLVGFEALLRWRHDTLGMQGPNLLSAAFDDINLATSLGECMLDSVCTDVRRWRDEGLAFGHVGINLSPAEFRRDDLFDRFMERLHQSNIPASSIELEITETVFLGRGAETVSDILSAFHREGMSIALDDFGTGYASLTHLQSFPVDVIKIDRSFVTNLAPSSANAAIVDAIIGLADRLNMRVIAEGIETDHEARYLLEKGCQFGQGFLFGKAVSYEAASDILARGHPQSAVKRF